jgi:O-Antigen ligase
MSAAVRSIIIAVAGLIVALYFGALVGQGSWLLPATLAGAVILLGVYIVVFKAIRLESLILGFLIFGYIVGNRGFAQLTLTAHAPTYLGELGMLACLALLGVRMALKRERFIPRSKLSLAIVAFITIGLLRLWCDIFLHLSPATTVVTLRDAATVYYALFFFIAYRVGSSPVGRRLVENIILFACIALLPVFIIQFIAAPDLFNRITVRGFPLIVQKGDLTATYLAFASFYFFLYPARGIARLALRLFAVIFFLGIFVVTARAAIVGYLGAALLLIVARRPQFVLWQMGIGLIGFIVLSVLHFAGAGEQDAVYTKLADKIESIGDPFGTHKYRGDVGDYAAGHNEFRMVWWSTVFNDTMRKGPIFGLGFGYDLTATFMRVYYPTGGDDTASTRSPHSIWITILGRMGIIGLLSFVYIAFLIVRNAFRAAKAVGRGKQPPAILPHWCAVLIILGSASFGVVLEGPMGGILFWSFLGLAASRLDEQQSAAEAVNDQPALGEAAVPRLVRV